MRNVRRKRGCMTKKLNRVRKRRRASSKDAWQSKVMLAHNRKNTPSNARTPLYKRRRRTDSRVLMRPKIQKMRRWMMQSRRYRLLRCVPDNFMEYVFFYFFAHSNIVFVHYSYNSFVSHSHSTYSLTSTNNPITSPASVRFTNNPTTHPPRNQSGSATLKYNSGM